MDFLPLEFYFSKSNSLPYNFFVSKLINEEIRKGDYVVFFSKEFNTYFVKQVKGLPNDTVDYISGHVYVDNFNCGKVLKKSSSGKRFTLIQGSKVPEGCLYLYGPHPESFDSRYNEMGFISQCEIKEVVWPLF
jgi:conjugal transfer pilin signal peptidase TrbI